MIRSIAIVLMSLFLITISYGQTENIYEVTKNTSLKSNSSSSSRTLLRLSTSDQVIYLDDCTKYYCKVEFNNEIGWVKKHLLQQVEVIQEPAMNNNEKIKDAPAKKEETTTSEENNTPPPSVNQETSSKSTAGYFISWYGAILLLIFLGLLIYLLFQLRKELKKYKIRYKGIDDVDKEIDKKRIDLKNMVYKYEEHIKVLDDERYKIKEDIKSLEANYEKGEREYKDLIYQQKLIRDDLDIAEFGVYEPQFDFDTSGVFKLKIKEIRDEQKQLIKESKAVLGGEGWEVNGSIVKGRSMIKKQKKLMLRAFNGECDSYISGVKWNNVNRIEEKILRSVDVINKMGETQRLRISTAYSTLKLIELKLTHEYNLKKYEEKEQQRLIREQIREEEKAKRDYEKALKEAEKEEKMIQNAMKIAQEKFLKASEEEKLIYQSKLSELTAQLQEAQEKNQRAISMAQQTKAGHVYVISNIGSFGENVFKIGMTRRLDPMDRVRELGDASVPFRFDVHAIIYSENAPELENKLHKHFDKYRLNHINRRREYFNVSLHDIKKVVEANYGEFEFIIEPEAKEYRESVVIREQLFAEKEVIFSKTAFPSWGSKN